MAGCCCPATSDAAERSERSLTRWLIWLERPETPGKWMKYFEQGPEGKRQLCRVENFLEHQCSALPGW